MAVTDGIIKLISVKIKPRQDGYFNQFIHIFMLKVAMIMIVTLGLNWYCEDVRYYANEAGYNANEIGYYGSNQDIQDDILQDGRIATNDRTHGENAERGTMEKGLFLRKEYMMFIMLATAALYYFPYILKGWIAEDDTDETMEHDFNNYQLIHPKRRTLQVLINILLKVLYIAINLIAMVLKSLLSQIDFNLIQPAYHPHKDPQNRGTSSHIKPTASYNFWNRGKSVIILMLLSYITMPTLFAKFNALAIVEKMILIAFVVIIVHSCGFFHRTEITEGEREGFVPKQSALPEVPIARSIPRSMFPKTWEQNEPEEQLRWRPKSQRKFEPTISDLLYKHVNTLSRFLDPDNGTGRSWEQLARIIFHGDRNAWDIINSINLAYFGGGSPAKEFLEALVVLYPAFTVAAFIGIAIQHRRHDISSYIRSLNCPLLQQFRDLTASEVNKIAQLLDKFVRVGGTWENFAGDVGFTYDEIKQLKLALKKPQMYSPTMCLVDFMRQKKPMLKLTEIQEALYNINRDDAAHYLDTVMGEIVATKEHEF